MSKYCDKCGKQLEDNDIFCDSCGNKLNEPQVEQENANVQQGENIVQNDCVQQDTSEDCGCSSCESTPSENNTGAVNDKISSFISTYISKLKSKDIPTIAISAGALVVVIVLLIVAISLMAGSPSEKAIDRYFDVTLKGKVGKVEDCAPEEYWEYIEDKYDVDIDDIEEAATKFYEDTIDELEEEYGKDIKYKFTVEDDDELSKNDISILKDKYKSLYDIPKKNVTDAIEYEIEATIKGDDDKDEDTNAMIVVEIDGDWYLAEDNFGLEQIVLYAIKDKAKRKLGIEESRLEYIESLDDYDYYVLE